VPGEQGVKRRLQERQRKRVAVPNYLARVALREVSELPQYGQRGDGAAGDDDDGAVDDGDDAGGGGGGGVGGGRGWLAINKA